MGELLVLAEQVAYLATANTDVAGGNVLVRTDHAVQLVHECLAEAHHLSVALAARREIRTTLCTTHRQCRQRVLEGLFEGQELQDTQVYALVVAQTAFVRADGVVVLDAVSHVGLHIPLVVHPCHAELIDTVGHAKALNEVGLLEFRVFVVLLLNGWKYLTDGLDILRLVGKSLFQIFYNLCCIHNLFLFLV